MGAITKPPVICWLCRLPIKGKVYFQGGQPNFPAHKNCRIVIKASKKHGGGI
jgi:hypothetical protein